MDNLSMSQLFDIDLENTDDQSELTLTFQALGELAGRKLKRHRAVSVQFFNEPEHQLIRAEEIPQQNTYINEDGELDFTLSMRQDRLQITIPYTVFPLLHYGDLVSADVNLENRSTGEVMKHETLTLVGTKNGNLEILSNHGMEVYLKSGIPAEEMLGKIGYWLEQNSVNHSIITKSLAMLKELADSGVPEAAKKIHEVYSEERFAITDQEAAEKWLSRIGEVDHAASVAAEKKEAEQLPEKITDDATLEKCESLADKGNAVAEWLIYQYSLTTEGSTYDKAKAFRFVKSAAQTGYAEAIAALSGAYTRNYVFVSRDQVRDYLSVLKIAADKKEPLAQYLLFQIYYDGWCLGESLPVDKKTAYYMLCSSAEGGNIDAAFRLWNFFEDGNEFLMEESDALKWLKTAAEKGFAAAEARLGDLYIDGQIVSKDNEKGLSYLQKAAEKKNWEAQLILYRSYYDGRYKDILFTQDKQKAFNFLEQFASGGNAKASMLIMENYLHGNEMMLEHREAVRYLKKAAISGYSPAMYQLANLLLDGLYLPQDLDSARKLLEEAAASGYPEAQFALYQYYCYGYKTLKNNHVNRERAYKWLLKAAETLSAAQYEVWILSKDRHYADLDLNTQEATDFLFRSAAQKYSPALYQVGMAFGHGVEVGKNTDRGISLIEEAVALHNPEAMFTLSEIRLNGEFGGVEVEKNENQALHWLLLSAEQEYGPACQKVGKLFAEGLLPDESEVWINQIVEIAGRAGYPLQIRESQKADQEVAAAKDSLKSLQK
ncbi:MAG: tetratricopeptide repeat protein [Sporolactobacillus sp.]